MQDFKPGLCAFDRRTPTTFIYIRRYGMDGRRMDFLSTPALLGPTMRCMIVGALKTVSRAIDPDDRERYQIALNPGEEPVKGLDGRPVDVRVFAYDPHEIMGCETTLKFDMAVFAIEAAARNRIYERDFPEGLTGGAS